MYIEIQVQYVWCVVVRYIRSYKIYLIFEDGYIIFLDYLWRIHEYIISSRISFPFQTMNILVLVIDFHLLFRCCILLVFFQTEATSSMVHVFVDFC